MVITHNDSGSVEKLKGDKALGQKELVDMSPAAAMMAMPKAQNINQNSMSDDDDDDDDFTRGDGKTTTGTVKTMEAAGKMD